MPSSGTLLQHVCIFLFITINTVSCSGSADPQLQRLHDQIYKLEVKLIVFYVFTGLLILIIFLMVRIARTYKLSLISAESKLQSLLIHSDHVLNQSAQFPMYQYASPRHPNQLNQTEMSVKTHHSAPIISANPPYPPSPMRNGSIWRKIGDYIIHVKANGEIESHNLKVDTSNTSNTSNTTNDISIMKNGTVTNELNSNAHNPHELPDCNKIRRYSADMSLKDTFPSMSADIENNLTKIE